MHLFLSAARGTSFLSLQRVSRMHKKAHSHKLYAPFASQSARGNLLPLSPPVAQQLPPSALSPLPVRRLAIASCCRMC